MSPLERLSARGQFAIKLGLENTRALLEALDNPHRQLRTIHVAGTNGKGSVAAFVASALTSAGLRTGLYTSPHLTHIEERISVDGVAVRPDVFRLVLEHVFEVEAEAITSGRMAGPATFFEVMTACAFMTFATARLDAAVIEVGMGGRFDATNVVEPIVTAITSISIDHAAYLGDTLAAIAAEKAGIMKPGVPCIAGDPTPEVAAFFDVHAARVGTPLHHALSECRWKAEIVDGVTRVTLATPQHDYGTMALSLNGRHQARNAVVAVRVLEEVSGAGLTVPAQAIAEGLAGTEWPARIEVFTLGDGRPVILDAAHNPAGAATLAEWLAEAHPGGVTLVVGLMQDKDAAAMLDALGSQARRIVCTLADEARGLDADTLAALARARVPGVEVVAIAAPQDALADALDQRGPICIAGSIYLAGTLRPALVALAGATMAAPTLH